jgi:AAHS family 4-hydroxybenzoate transporter-like MFS transporter
MSPLKNKAKYRPNELFFKSREFQMSANNAVDVSTLIERNQIGSFQIMVFVLCGLSVIIDGFDFQIIGFVAPSIVKEWGGDSASLGPVFAAGVLGLVLGSFIFGSIADKIGRRPVLIFSTFFFSLCMVSTVFANSISQLVIIRFVTGIGLGSIMPNAMALVAEFSPRHKRLTLTIAISTCFTAGAVLGGLTSAAMIPLWGWRSVFYAGSIAPAMIAVLMLMFLPESIQFLVVTGNRMLAVKWLTRIVGPGDWGAETDLVVSESSSKRASVVQLFKEGRALTTTLLWMVSFLNLLNLLFLSSWLPSIVVGDGLSISMAVLAGTALQVGGVVGAILMGQLIEWFGFRKILIPCFLIASVALVLVGRPALSLLFLFTVVTISGFCIIGGQSALNGLAASYYPTALRSTGAGWALGAGRLGSVLGPIIGGVLIGMQLPSSTIFIIAAFPPILSAVMIWALNQDGWKFASVTRTYDGPAGGIGAEPALPRLRAAGAALNGPDDNHFSN